METYVEIKWMGRFGQGLTTAATVLAEVFALAGRYVQACPAFTPEKQPCCLYAYNRFSHRLIKNQSAIRKADIVVVFEPALMTGVDLGTNAKKEAIYIINTSYDPQWVKAKLTIPTGLIYTLDADLIAREECGVAIPNMPMIAVVNDCLQWLSIADFKQKLQQTLNNHWSLYPERILANLNTIERAVQEVKRLKSND